jgi:hypothetical protein
MNIKKLLLLLSCSIVPNILCERFPGSAANYQNYYFGGNFGFQTPYDANTGKNANYYYVINSFPNLDLPANTPMRLATVLGDRISQLKIINGTKIILKPEVEAMDATSTDKQSLYDTVPYVVIDRENDFITVYLYNIKHQIGTKLVFNVLAFEDFMMKTQLAKTAAPSTGWQIGFEFFTAETDFVGTQLIGEQPTLFKNQQGITPFFIDLVFDQYEYEKAKSGFFKDLFQWYDRVPSPFKELEPYFPAQYFVALNGSNFDKSKWNPNVFSQNNIVYTKALSNTDVDDVQKILTDAGITLSAS